MVGKIQTPHTWIIMNRHVLKSCHIYFHWYNVSNRNENVTEVRLIVNMPFKRHNVEGHAHIDAKWIIIYLESYVVWMPITQTYQIDSMWNSKYLNILKNWSHREVVCGWKGKMFLVDILTSHVSGGLL